MLRRAAPRGRLRAHRRDLRAPERARDRSRLVGPDDALLRDLLPRPRGDAGGRPALGRVPDGAARLRGRGRPAAVDARGRAPRGAAARRPLRRAAPRVHLALSGVAAAERRRAGEPSVRRGVPEQPARRYRRPSCGPRSGCRSRTPARCGRRRPDAALRGAQRGRDGQARAAEGRQQAAERRPSTTAKTMPTTTIAGVMRKAKAISLKLCGLAGAGREAVHREGEQAAERRRRPGPGTTDSITNENRIARREKPERAQGADLARARGHDRVHRVHGPEHGADAHDDGDAARPAP